MEVNLCMRCKRLFQSSSQLTASVCRDCFMKHEDDFKLVRNYIRENPETTISELAEACNIKTEYIKQWIKEERIICVNGTNKVNIID